MKDDLSNMFFDSRWIGDHGIGRFALEIQAQLPKLPIITFGGSPSSPIDCVRTWLWLVRNPNKILFTPGYNAPLFCQNRCVLTVHDLNHIDAPGKKSFLKRTYYNLILKRACRNARLVFTVSGFSRNRILSWSGVDRTKVVNVGNGVSNVFYPSQRRMTADPNPFFLCVSNRKSHKNEKRTFHSFLEADLPPEVKLLITGDPTEDQRAWLHRSGSDRRIVFLGRISDELLAEYYRRALGLIFASLYEGFGLPALEAMACGTPVVASNTSALPELVGDAGLQVNPLNISEIRHAIERLFHDAELREMLSKKGLERAKEFTWERVSYRLNVALRSYRTDFSASEPVA
jgi:glycosyltransferase involved in cell wall biosynthesis